MPIDPRITEQDALRLLSELVDKGELRIRRESRDARVETTIDLVRYTDGRTFRVMRSVTSEEAMQLLRTGTHHLEEVLRKTLTKMHDGLK